MVQVELNGLAKYKLVETNGVDVQTTPAGRLMARYYVAFQTMKAFLQVSASGAIRPSSRREFFCCAKIDG